MARHPFLVRLYRGSNPFIPIMLRAPLEQFQILQLVPINILIFDLSITNFLLINFLTAASFLSFIYYTGKNCHMQILSFFLIPNAWQKLIEGVNEISVQLIYDTISINTNKYFILISVLFNFILFSNLIVLIPYSFTVTSHLIITFILSFSVFIAINFITFSKYKIKSFNLFLPADTSFFLALLLVPIEFVSYIAKPISLGVRLFINLMAGHSLLKVIVGFAWSMSLMEGVQALSFLVPLFILTLLMGLELGVALIQTYVFITLTCIYLNESEVLH